MATLATKKSPKIAIKFFCEKCNYICSKKSDFDKHLLEVQDEGDPEAPGILYKGVWFDDANFKDVSGQVNLTDDE